MQTENTYFTINNGIYHKTNKRKTLSPAFSAKTNLYRGTPLSKLREKTPSEKRASSRGFFLSSGEKTQRFGKNGRRTHKKYKVSREMYNAANEFSNRRKERIRFTGNESNPFPCRFPKTGGLFFRLGGHGSDLSARKADDLRAHFLFVRRQRLFEANGLISQLQKAFGRLHRR